MVDERIILHIKTIHGKSYFAEGMLYDIMFDVNKISKAGEMLYNILLFSDNIVVTEEYEIDHKRFKAININFIEEIVQIDINEYKQLQRSKKIKTLKRK